MKIAVCILRYHRLMNDTGQPGKEKAMKPILFNTKMVRAILDGRKTVTRRVMKEPPPNVPTAKFRRLRGEIAIFAWDCSTNLCERKTPYQPGDILYIRETWCKLPVTPGGHARGHDLYYYKADGDYRPEQCRGAWKPSIHMPKEAARLFLRVTEVRAERLQDITSEGKTAEYATEDRLHNFRVAAAVEGITPRQALAGMMAKHTMSVYDMCRAGDYSLDQWAEKITDSINYLLLLWALVVDEEEGDA